MKLKKRNEGSAIMRKAYREEGWGKEGRKLNSDKGRKKKRS